MLNILLAVFLLVIYPAINLYLSLYLKRSKPPRLPMRRYGMMVLKTSILLALLWAGALQAGYSPRALGLDVPVSREGLWGLGIAALLAVVLAALSYRDSATPAAVRDQRDDQMLESNMPWPRTTREAVAFAVTMTFMTAAWELLYRGFLLLFLAPSIGLPLAVTASALAYGIGHGYINVRQLLAAVASAFVFTIAYALTKSLWWLILIHAALPLTAIPAVLRAYKRRENGSAAEGTVEYSRQ